MTNFLRRIVDNELWVIAPAVMASMAYPALLPAALITALLLLGLRRLVTRSWGRSSGLTLPLLILIVMGGVSLLITAFPQITIPQVLRLYTGIALFLAIVNYGVNPSRLRLLLISVMLAGLGLALAAPFSVTWATEKLDFIPKGIYQDFLVLVQDAIHPNVLGGNLAILLPISLGVILFQPRQIPLLWRAAAIGIAALEGGVILLSLSRGAVMGVGAALVLLIALRWRWGWLAAPGILVAASPFAAKLGWVRLWDMLLVSRSLSGLDGRVEIWKHGWYMLQDFLFTGIGMGSFLETANRFYPFAAVNVTTGPKIYHVHNLFLQVALDLGAPGFLAWLAILVGVTWAAWQVYRTGRRSGQPFYACLGAGILASQAALIVHGMTDAVTWGMVRPAPIVWGLWGIAAAAWLTLREAQPATAALAPGAALVETAAAPESAPGLR